MSDEADIQIRVRSDPRYLSVVRSAVEEAARRLGFTDDAAHKIVLAVDEALTNVIRHGYGGRTDGAIVLSINPVTQNGKRGVEFNVFDRCSVTDLSKIKARDMKDVKPGGLGVHIIQEVMDHVDYRLRDDGPGLHLRMIKLGAADPK